MCYSYLSQSCILELHKHFAYKTFADFVHDQQQLRADRCIYNILLITAKKCGKYAQNGWQLHLIFQKVPASEGAHPPNNPLQRKSGAILFAGNATSLDLPSQANLN